MCGRDVFSSLRFARLCVRSLFLSLSHLRTCMMSPLATLPDTLSRRMDRSESALEQKRVAGVAGASSSQGAPGKSLTCALDLRSRQLLINGHVAKFDTFSDEPSEPWFEAKAIRNALGCSTITQSLERLHQDDKMSFGDLI